MARDIAAETLKVGNAMTSVRIDQMILNLAKGIAWGQYELDKVGVEIARMMGVPGTVSIGDERLSMLEAGFIPSFYHFVDTILEIKMEVNFREESSSAMGFKQAMSTKMETEVGAEVGFKAKAGVAIASAEVSAKAHYKAKSSSAYSRSIDASHSQKFSQDLSATSLMRTKLVPIPPPELLVERVRILLERLREEATTEEAEQGFLFEVSFADIGASVGRLESNEIPDELREAFSENDLALPADSTKIRVETFIQGESWSIQNQETSKSYPVKTRGSKLRVYRQVAEEERKSFDEILMEKVEDRVLERMEEKLSIAE